MTTLTAELRAPYAPPRRRPDATLELLSSIAHELRTPLSALTASAEMLQVADDGDSQRRFAAIIQRQTSRLTSIVEGLLESYRAGDGELADTGAGVDIEDLLFELCGEHELMFPRHRWVLDVKPGANGACDRRALGMVLSNLMTNAAKYSPVDSTVRIVCEQREGTIAIRVSDEGPGVPEFLRRRIFSAGDRGTRNDRDGCGLGLFIARRLCDAIGAELEVESRDGEGACFTVRLNTGKEGAA